jgi:hypothetical protein
MPSARNKKSANWSNFHLESDHKQLPFDFPNTVSLTVQKTEHAGSVWLSAYRDLSAVHLFTLAALVMLMLQGLPIAMLEARQTFPGGAGGAGAPAAIAARPELEAGLQLAEVEWQAGVATRKLCSPVMGVLKKLCHLPP